MKPFFKKKKLCHRERSCCVDITHCSTAAEISPELKMAGDGERQLEIAS